jgi:hypothetical protein
MNNTNSEANKNNYAISINLLGGLLIAFLAGYFVHNFLINSEGTDIYSFTTPDLINFILSVILSGASIVLAISAISLGKFSEQAMTQRSDESIRLQNEIFLKTTDALQRIESSTGVTEKRIEDIISGRVGDLSQKIVRIATESGEKEGSLQPKEIEDLIRKTLLQSLNKNQSVENTGIQHEKEQQDEEQRKYFEYHDNLETCLTQREDLRALKLGQGHPGESGLDIFDSVFVTKEGKKIAIIDFNPAFSKTIFRSVLQKVSKEIQKDTVNFVYLLVFQPSEDFVNIFDEFVSIIDDEIKTRVSFSTCPPDKIETFVKSLTI